MSYLCQTGQGEIGTTFKSIQHEDITECKKECTMEATCVGFDFAKTERNDACRLYRPNTIRPDGGNDDRKYCKRITEGNNTL